MRTRSVIHAALIALGMLTSTAWAEDRAAAMTPEQRASKRALTFLTKDAAKWRETRGCATCHHGTMTVWALSEARRQGYEVDMEALADVAQWTKEQFVPQFRGPRDPRFGYNFVNLAGIYLAVMSQDLPVLSRQEVNQVAVHLARHQEPDGVWLLPPGGNGSPPTWESPETVALLAALAWERQAPDDSAEATAARVSREKMMNWLGSTKPTDTIQAAALRLVLGARNGVTGDQLKPQAEALLKRQESDGGFRQTSALPSDAYATGQTLWALSIAGVKIDRPEIKRAVSFLVANQRDDGSWPMTGRNHPGFDSAKARNPVPITYFGSAWATIGLVRFVPPALDLATRRRRAFDTIRMLSGTPRADESALGRSVESVTIGNELDDQQLETLASLLVVFPELKSLQFQSPKISDAGLPYLKGLTNLRSLSLENAAVTDAGLTHLEGLPLLEELNLKGARVTDRGVHDFEEKSPRIKVKR